MTGKLGFFRSRLMSFKHAFHGIKVVFRSQANFRIQLIAAIIITILGFSLAISATEWLILIILIGMVLVAEAFNSAIELLSDKVESSYDQTIKKVKDITAGAVLICSISALIIGLIIFLPKLISLFT